MARIKQITFSVVRTFPLNQITGDPADQYANIKPFAGCTIEFDADEADLKKHEALVIKQVVKDAFAEATALAFEQMIDFKQELMRQHREARETRASTTRKRDRTADGK